ncbi:3',5'-cyclic-AMP phosphodiesterase [Pseudomonas sp. FW306-02-F02-AA]|uniref:Metallophosphoesterase n=1 Tax=Pseudomonas fluorescens TaxID=294 RepID=A0A0N9WFU6_PSEFL|nr:MULTISPECIES: metallophosphoesterase [Pseudomonas]ALI03471.1 metallophosphoesterase [Pseudomonas fluorescens]PMZ03499.1 3',5'-cyclic-AMP phosphodiesterase [Pseudomonas sp. FW306-02-F02-AB]PMZ09654.1 3',5'-cyclic-AMP phosphodiesterase [Pseudomonas sp. FW306-02-H06C]PMZ15394.1 3',5'-cyclic-AMP phosphodiesterase [Pseudomonas sp. FW306-02-F02-AA]PMZ21163.1 3',5'-cyclic-AMP phosphodiesterase [Pseudomonas sp. FW306-02-F08-AA]
MNIRPASHEKRTDGPLDPDRRHLLKCSAWAGAGVIWALSGGIPRAFALGEDGQVKDPKALDSTFHFVQISDSHIGFNKEANPEPLKTLQVAIDKVIALPKRPSLILHTGDITHLSKPEEFDTAASVLKGLPSTVHYIPGEHDTLDEGGGKLYLERYGKGTKGNGWYSFNDHGVHFIALVNVFNFQAGHEATLGAEQLAWLQDDLKAVSTSTPVVVFTHIPLWTIYQPWGWGTEDGDQAIAMLRKYGSVTVLNGHIHQVIQKVEGNITFHTARGTAYPQPAPGVGPAPGPMTVAADQLRNYLGITEVKATQGDHPLALIDSTLV